MINSRTRKFPWLVYWIALFLITVFALWPIASVVTCSVIANSHGCQVDEGSVHPCVINGKDYGQLLNTLGVLGWFMLITIPAGMVLGIVWLVVLLMHRSSWRKRMAMAAGPPPIPAN